MDWSYFGNIATVIGVTAALITFLKGVIEYSRQNAQKRAEHFVEMRRRLKENETFRKIVQFLETDSLALEKEIKEIDKIDFLGFFEEIALMVNSRLIRKEVAHYMFGYYAITCWDNEHFWSNIDRKTLYWSLFRDFVEQMKDVEKSFQYDRRKFRL